MGKKIRIPAGLNTYSGLPGSIYIIFIARIINCIGNFVYPFLTIFLTKNLAMGKEEAGAFLLVASLAHIPGSLIGGKLADHIGRKRIMIAFQALAALCFVPCAFLGNSMIIPWLLTAASFFGGAAGPAQGAMVTDLTTPENRKSAYSLLYLGVNIGSAIGPMIAGLLYAHYIKWIFLGDAATTLMALTLVGLFIKETIPSKEKIEESQKNDDSDERAEEGGIISALLKRPALLVFAFISMAYSFVYAQHRFSIPMQVNEVFGESGPKIFGTLMSVNALVVIFLTTFIVKITEKLRAIFNVMLAGMFYAVGFGMLYYLNSYPMFVVSTVVWTLGEILNATNSGVYISDHSPISHRGRFNAVLNLITGAGYALGPAVMGRFLNEKSARMAWPLAFIFASSATFMMYVLYLIEKRNEKIKIQKMYANN